MNDGLMFTGFPSAGLALLERLPTFDKAEFEQHRDAWENELRLPAHQLAQAVGARLVEEVSAGFISQSQLHTAVSPINRDMRFDQTGPRYKDHLLLRWWEGAAKKVAPTLMVRLDATSVGFATGVTFASTADWRAAVGQPEISLRLVAAIDEVKRRAPSVEMAGRELKRIPRPFPDDHPGRELLRHSRALQLRWTTPLGPEIHSAALVDLVMRELSKATPVHAELVSIVAP
ncbi:DUF2461 family protein [Nocardioides dilutus]